MSIQDIADNTQASPSTGGTAEWADQVAKGAESGKCLTLGLVSASRSANDQLQIDALADALTTALQSQNADARVLLIRLDVFASRDLQRAADQPASIPVAHRSPLGPWSEVTIPMPIGLRASWSLQQFPAWIPEWKQAFDAIMIDLGPIAETPSRVAGRSCDVSYLLLSNTGCGSHEWLMEQIAWHNHAGSHIGGTLYAPTAA